MKLPKPKKQIDQILDGDIDFEASEKQWTDRNGDYYIKKYGKVYKSRIDYNGNESWVRVYSYDDEDNDIELDDYYNNNWKKYNNPYTIDKEGYAEDDEVELVSTKIVKPVEPPKIVEKIKVETSAGEIPKITVQFTKNREGVVSKTYSLEEYGSYGVPVYSAQQIQPIPAPVPKPVVEVFVLATGGRKFNFED